MSWTDTIHKASFRGIPFFISSGEGPRGRRIVTHTFPGRDTAYLQDLGRKNRIFAIEGHVIGDDYINQLNALEAAAEAPGAAELVHPVYGMVRVRCEDFTPRFTDKIGRIGRFSLRCIEDSNESVSGRVGTDTAAAVKEAAQAVQDAATEDFISTFAIGGTPSRLLDKITDTVISAVQTINNVRLDTRSMSQVQFLYNQFTRDPLSYLRTPRNLADLVLSMVTAVSEAASPWLRLKSNVNLLSKTEELLETEQTSLTPDELSAAVIEYTELVTVAETAIAASSAEYPTYDDALEIRETFGGAVDRISEYATDETYELLYTLRAAVIRDIDTRSFDAPKVVNFTPLITVPSLVLAYELYGDISRVDEIVTRNGVEHPGFIPGGVKLEVLSNE